MMKNNNEITVKILSLGRAERYTVWRLVATAYQNLVSQKSVIELKTIEVDDAAEIGKYAQALVLPSLVVNEVVVCSGRFPSLKEVTRWLLEAANKF